MALRRLGFVMGHPPAHFLDLTQVFGISRKINVWTAVLCVAINIQNHKSKQKAAKSPPVRNMLFTTSLQAGWNSKRLPEGCSSDHTPSNAVISKIKRAVLQPRAGIRPVVCCVVCLHSTIWKIDFPRELKPIACRNYSSLLFNWCKDLLCSKWLPLKKLLGNSFVKGKLTSCPEFQHSPLQ